MFDQIPKQLFLHYVCSYSFSSLDISSHCHEYHFSGENPSVLFWCKFNAFYFPNLNSHCLRHSKEYQSQTFTLAPWLMCMWLWITVILRLLKPPNSPKRNWVHDLADVHGSYIPVYYTEKSQNKDRCKSGQTCCYNEHEANKNNDF